MEIEPTSQQVESPLATSAAKAERVARLEATPWVTYTLLAVIIAVYIAMLVVGHGNVDRVALLFGDKEDDLIRQGQWWRLVTAIFLHGSWVHIGVNGLSLYWLGNQMERLYGRRRFFVLFIFSGICGNLLSFLKQPAPSLGASGALFGLIGAGIVFPIRYPKLISPKVRKAILTQLIWITVLNLALSLAPGIDLWAHVGGLIGGGFLALFLMPALLDPRPVNLWRERALSLITLGTVLLCLSSAGLEWRVAVKLPQQETQMTYAPSSQNPWWSLKVPKSWRPIALPQGAGVVLVSPQGEQLTVAERIGASPVQDFIALWPQGVQPQRGEVAGKPAWFAQLQSGNAHFDVCVVQPYTTSFVRLVLMAPSAMAPKAHNDFLQILKTMEFHHPP